MSSPRVTVLTTLYNKGPFVERAVRSILDGTFGDFELLIVDDASTDDGLERVRRFTDPRIRILTSAENTGRAAAANRGYDAARGEYVAVLDADDVAHPERLAEQIAFLDAHPDIGVCGSYAQTFGVRDHVATWPTTDEEARGLLLFQDPLLYGSAMIRRSVLEENGIRCLSDWRTPGMDYLFLLAIAKHTHTATIPEPLMSYRLGDQNFRHGHDLIEVRAKIYREVFRFYNIPASEEEIALQLLFHRLYRELPDARTIRSLFRWAAKLKTFNKEHRLFTSAVFEARLDQELGRWYYVLADHVLWPSLTHLWLMGGWPGGRLAYLVRSRLSRLFRKL
ncbi:MAG: glycosyltransferase family 2 protein [Flavobacteriales bacterium]|nr:glycosyltransferase family 2 protein [Flavobacteriales bacterium]